MVDAVLRVLDMEIHRHETSVVKTEKIVYADDVYIFGIDGERVQRVMEHATTLFSTLGLRMNYGKTNIMIGQGGHRTTRLSNIVYKRRITDVGGTYKL